MSGDLIHDRKQSKASSVQRLWTFDPVILKYRASPVISTLTKTVHIHATLMVDWTPTVPWQLQSS